MREPQQADNARSVLILLALANLLNFFDRTLPAVVAEPIRREWGLSDLQLGLLSTAFVVVYAIAGVPLGRLADRASRRHILGWGLAAWSAFTGLTGMAWSYASLVAIRMGVGVGEACYGPAASSLIGDLYPPQRRSRAIGVFMLGLPLGLMLCFFTVGPLVQAFGSWRAPFFIAMVPGLLLALALFRIREPARGAADSAVLAATPPRAPIRAVLRIRTMWWIVLSGLTLNFASYATGAFMVPLMQRHFGLPIGTAALLAGLITGATGLIGLSVGGVIADRAHARSERGRLNFGAGCLLVAALGTGGALWLGAANVALFTGLFALGWLTYYTYYICVYPAVQDVVEPRLRATAMALYFAALYLLGGAIGPVVVGAWSDRLAHAAMGAAGASEMSDVFKAAGLYGAMYLVPTMMLATAIFVWLASRTFPADARRMREAMGRSANPDAVIPDGA